MWVWTQNAWVQTSTLSFSSCVTLGYSTSWWWFQNMPIILWFSFPRSHPWSLHPCPLNLGRGLGVPRQTECSKSDMCHFWGWIRKDHAASDVSFWDTYAGSLQISFITKSSHPEFACGKTSSTEREAWGAPEGPENSWRGPEWELPGLFAVSSQIHEQNKCLLLVWGHCIGMDGYNTVDSWSRLFLTWRGTAAIREPKSLA